MPAPLKRLMRAFLWAGELTAVLAVVAGILGMHVITGNHSIHSMTAMSARTPGGLLALHTEGPAESHPHPASGLHAVQEAADHGMGSVDRCCGSCCTGIQTMTVSCTPSAKSGSLAAPLPGTSVFGAVPGTTAPGSAAGSYSYLPGGPSPGALCISRT
ncbi:hypothetical protein LFT45_17525 [Arthrobacter sp. FW305-BF8]|uniref:hypothetical protein n=1 Tax=Arthrobacter sp. FW305-BF8 TaxID=2879617 RepID=UPI001F2C3091|nr:hypothetical protein [Arthrobacter sp. FW305-BF8]UKA53500.1 hypothetical protein LFT45_17525 [Arthrobacter sp. FW305-BF8]